MTEYITTGFEVYKAFDKNESTYYMSSPSPNNEYIGYMFNEAKNIIKLSAMITHPHGTSTGILYGFDIYTNDGNTWTKFSDFETGKLLTGECYQLNIMINSRCKGIKIVRTKAIEYDSSDVNMALKVPVFYVYGRN